MPKIISRFMRRRRRAYSRIRRGEGLGDRLRLWVYFILSMIIPWTLCYRFQFLNNFMILVVKGIKIRSMGNLWEIGHYRDFVSVDPDYEGPISDWFNHGSDIFLDVGSYIGRYSLILSQRFNKIYSFEPVSETYSRLRKNIDLNQIKNIYPVRVALMDFDGTMKMSLKNAPGTNSLIHDKNSLSSEIIDTVKLDTFFFNGKVDLIKVDVEGAEKEFLRGAEKIIRWNKPRLIIEVEPENRDYVDRFLKRLGYHEELICHEWGGQYHCYDFREDMSS